TAVPRPTLPRPIQPESLAVPGNHRFRLDDSHGSTPALPQSRQPDPKHTICRFQPKPATACRTLEDKKLMAQGQDLSLKRSVGFHPAEKPGRYQAENRQHWNATGYRVRPARSILSIRTEFLLGTGSRRLNFIYTVSHFSNGLSLRAGYANQKLGEFG